MAFYCFDVLIAYFEKNDVPKPIEFENDEYPLFVTWTKEKTIGKGTSLRGCIGTFSPQKIHSGLKEYALTSALRDKRFQATRASEVPQLHCGVSLLTNFEEVEDIYDWEIGKHGIWIDFKDPNGVKRNGTYLPEVAPEQGWTKIECLDSLVRKAGYQGEITDSLRLKIKVTRYQSSKVYATYQEYITYREKNKTNKS